MASRHGAYAWWMVLAFMLGAMLVPTRVVAQDRPTDSEPLTCSEVLEAALPPSEAAAALARCREFQIKNAALALGANPLPDAAEEAPTCRETVMEMTEPGPGQPRGPAHDRIEITVYGTGRNQRLLLPGARSGEICFTGCDDDIGNEFRLQDYTHHYQAATESLLRPGGYSAEILPPDRQGLLVVDEREFPGGQAGAVILWRNDAPEAPPLVIHAGSPLPAAVARLPTLLATPQEMDRLIGTLLSLRNPAPMMPFSVSSWHAQKDTFGDDKCRLYRYAPYNVEVRAGKAGFWSRHFGKGIGGKVQEIAKVDPKLPPAVVSWEQIDRAQMTAGISALGFLLIMQDVKQRIQAKSAEIRAVAYANDSIEARRLRLTRLNEETVELLAESAILLEGFRESARNEGFTSNIDDWNVYVRDLEDVTLRLEELGQNEMEAVLKPGDAGGNVQTLWLPSSQQSLSTGTCQLETVERKLPPLVFPLDLPQGKRQLAAQGSGRFWFVQVPGKNDTYRMRSSIRYDMSQVRSEHRAMAKWYLGKAMKHDCSNRYFLEKTSQAPSQSGAIELHSGVRYEYWHCASFKYPCGISLKGTKSCKKHIRTRVFRMGQSARHRLVPSVEGSELVVALQGQGISPIDGRFDLESVPEVRNLMITTGLMPDSVRFTQWDDRLWHNTELKGDVDLSGATACMIQSTMGQK